MHILAAHSCKNHQFTADSHTPAHTHTQNNHVAQLSEVHHAISKPLCTHHPVNSVCHSLSKTRPPCNSVAHFQCMHNVCLRCNSCQQILCSQPQPSLSIMVAHCTPLFCVLWSPRGDEVLIVFCQSLRHVDITINRSLDHPMCHTSKKYFSTTVVWYFTTLVISAHSAKTFFQNQITRIMH